VSQQIFTGKAGNVGQTDRTMIFGARDSGAIFFLKARRKDV
jgi:hypothetical protein